MVWNDLKKNRLMSVTITMFVTVVACMFALTTILSVYLLGSIQNLMNTAKTPDFLQMHAGELHMQQLERFTEQHEEIEAFQVCGFLNLNSGDIYLNGHSMIDSTQDNGLSIQSETFDFLLDMNNQKPVVKQGEIYVPVCYMQEYGLEMGMEMRIGNHTFLIAGFIRDSQMNSMMASSKRFLVCEEDYENLRLLGKEEYLIEFLLKDNADIQVFCTDYADAGLDANGPMITGSLIRMMNALSDGVMIMIILLVSIALLFIAMLCIRFSVLTKLEQDKREIGTLKALGISKKDINRLYFTKFLLLAAIGLILGLFAAFLLQGVFIREMQELYGTYHNSGMTIMIAAVGAALVVCIMLRSIWKTLKRTARMSVIEAINGRGEAYKLSVWKQYVIIAMVLVSCVSMTLIPENMANTFASPKFATYMGIGNGEIRIDINQTEDIHQKTAQVEAMLLADDRVEKYSVLQTGNYKRRSLEGELTNLTVEIGDHTIFPVSYSSGETPKREGEIALSCLNAEDMGVKTGDSVTLLVGQEEVVYEVCGIYSDITNGGKSAKMVADKGNGENREDLMWSVIYLSVKEGIDTEQLTAEYRLNMQEKELDASIIDVESYIKATYGPTILQIQRMAKLIMAVAVMIIVVVVALFVRLVIEKDRYKISLYKALGFTTKDLKYRYYRNYLICGIVSVVIGIVAGNMLGELVAGMFLNSLGAYGFEFIINKADVFMKIPAVIILSVIIAVSAGLVEIKKMKAYECCLRRE